MKEEETDLILDEAKRIMKLLTDQGFKCDDDLCRCRSCVVEFYGHKLKLEEKLVNNVSYESEYCIILTGTYLEDYLCTRDSNDALTRIFYILSEYKYNHKETREKKFVDYELCSEQLIQEAIVFAAWKHDGQVRKGTNIPYIVHPMHVMSILQRMNCTTDVIIAGILHDTLEDTETTENEIKTKFGSKVLEHVKGMSEDKTKTWKERKSTTIKELATCSEAVKYICFADKYSNLLSMYNDLQSYKESLWDRFNASKKEIEWYYRGVGDVLFSTFRDYNEYEAYIKLLDKVFGA